MTTRITTEIGARGVATILLNRPDRGNCYDQAMLDELAGALQSLGDDPAVRIVVLRGAGKHFCVGADIGWHQGTQDGAAEKGAEFIDVLIGMDTLAKPTVAMLHGACIGGGLAMAMCCDVALATEDSFCSIPELRLGFTPTSLAPLFLRAMGTREFRRYALSGERITAAEALRLGLVHQVSADGEIEAVLAGIVEGMLLGAPLAQAALKAEAARLGGAPVTAALLRELEAGFQGALASAEAVEGVAAFLEKRKPSWYPK
jgi:methylglutaconyl-CoA hydratase